MQIAISGSDLIGQFYGMNYLTSFINFSAKVKRKLQSYIKREEKTPNFHYEMVFQDKEALKNTKSKLLQSNNLKNIFEIDECLTFLDKFKKGHIEFSPARDANFISFLVTVTHMEDAISGEKLN